MTTRDAHVASPEQERTELAFDRGVAWPDFVDGRRTEIGMALAENCDSFTLGDAVVAWLEDVSRRGMGPAWAVDWLRRNGCADLVRRAREAYVEEALRR